MNEQQRQIQEKCIAFAVKIDALRKALNKKHHEYNKADQIDRSASAIGALYSEAMYAESKADMVHKLSIAQKECKETKYWLTLIHKCGYIDDNEFKGLMLNAEELFRVITAIIKAMKEKKNV